jgi:hypothetical protein
MRTASFPLRARRVASQSSDWDFLGAIVLTFANPFVWLLWATAYQISLGGVL